MRRKTLPLALLGVAGLGLLLAGCGIGLREKRLPETGASIEGKVTYGNEPVMAALIIVQSKDGASQGVVGEDGRYKVENVPIGPVSIGVDTNAGKGMMMGRVVAHSQGKGPAPPKMID